MGGEACKAGDLLARCMAKFRQHRDEGVGADWADALDGAQALFLGFDRGMRLHNVTDLLLDLFDLDVDEVDFILEEASKIVAIGGLAAVGRHGALIQERLAMFDKRLKFFSFWVWWRPALQRVEPILAVKCETTGIDCICLCAHPMGSDEGLHPCTISPVDGDCELVSRF